MNTIKFCGFGDNCLTAEYDSLPEDFTKELLTAIKNECVNCVLDDRFCEVNNLAMIANSLFQGESVTIKNDLIFGQIKKCILDYSISLIEKSLNF